nr:MAG TPA: hypothetical protein [Caudoviricetes sp.]
MSIGSTSSFISISIKYFSLYFLNSSILFTIFSSLYLL